MDAANASVGDDTIVVQGHLGPVQLTRVGALEDGNDTGDLDVDDPSGGKLTVTGTGNATIVGVPAPDQDRVFHVQASNADDVRFQNVTITAGAVLGVSAGQAGGGCLAHEGSGTLRIEGSTFAGCEAYVHPTVVQRGGGAVDTASDTIITDSSFHQNKVDLGTGGAVYATDTIDIEDTDFVGNRATCSASCSVSIDGGAIFVTDTSPSIFTNRVRITNNAALDNAGGMHAAADTIELVATIFEDNEAINGSAGGLFVLAPLSAGSPLVRDSAFVTNVAGGAGAGARINNRTGAVAELELVNNTFSNNAAGTSGGALMVSEAGISGHLAEVQLTHNTFTENSASSSANHIRLQRIDARMRNNLEYRGLGAGCWTTGGATFISDGWNHVDGATASHLCLSSSPTPDDMANSGLPADVPSPLDWSLGFTPIRTLDSAHTGVDAMTCVISVAVDQHGNPRPGAGGPSTTCEPGAWELTP